VLTLITIILIIMAMILIIMAIILIMMVIILITMVIRGIYIISDTRQKLIIMQGLSTLTVGVCKSYWHSLKLHTQTPPLVMCNIPYSQ